MSSGDGIINAMTVDVEDYFQVSAFDPVVGRRNWDSQEVRVERNTDRILALFDNHDVRATFFVLGWIAERYPDLVRRIAEQGHEVASHGYDHTRVTAQSPDQFTEDVIRTQQLLEDLSGKPVVGYRAASFSIGADNLWALDRLQEAGYRYSSSIYPISHDHYGMPDAPRFAFRPGSSGFCEVPVSTLRIARRNLPCGGGGYFRLLPYAWFHHAVNRINRRENRPAVFYFHPWEIDPHQPRPGKLPLKTRFRHYVNLSRTESRLARLLHDFRWGRMDRIFLEDDGSCLQ